jgi:hypothetical protein
LGNWNYLDNHIEGYGVLRTFEKEKLILGGVISRVDGGYIMYPSFHSWLCGD